MGPYTRPPHQLLLPGPQCLSWVPVNWTSHWLPVIHRHTLPMVPLSGLLTLLVCSIFC
ncbi:unnamed protein product, partial [Staurois parvus]